MDRIAGYLFWVMLRPALLAGQWYPADATGCRAAMETHAALADPEQGPWRGLIAPHAGWFYSGDACGRGYRWLAHQKGDADLVVIFASHRGPHGPNTLLRADGWETPVGALTVAHDLLAPLSEAVELADEPTHPRHPDNAAEVHMPFLRYFFPRAELLMVGVGASPQAVAIGRAVGEVVRGAKRNAVFVGSTDLTHYGPNYRYEPHGPGSHGVEWVRHKNDAEFIDQVLSWRPERAVEHAQQQASACCPGAVAACMGALEQGTPKLIDHYLSCDVRPSSSFVGYASILL